MPDREKIIKAWDCCKPMFNRKCMECPYVKDCNHEGVSRIMVADAVELLKDQEEQLKILHIANDKIAEYLKNPEIVRCKDCINGKIKKDEDGGSHVDCLLEDDWLYWPKDPNWFCPNGKIRIKASGEALSGEIKEE